MEQGYLNSDHCQQGSVHRVRNDLERVIPMLPCVMPIVSELSINQQYRSSYSDIFSFRIWILHPIMSCMDNYVFCQCSPWRGLKAWHKPRKRGKDKRRTRAKRDYLACLLNHPLWWGFLSENPHNWIPRTLLCLIHAFVYRHGIRSKLLYRMEWMVCHHLQGSQRRQAKPQNSYVSSFVQS